jgi:DNA-binding MarR family transcriptional regulator
MATTTVRRADVAQELFDLWHAIRRVTLEKFNEDGLSFSRAKVLWTLEESGPLRASTLAEHLDCAAATATELVDALTRDELVARTPDPRDRRAVLIDLTPAGREVARVTLAHKRRILENVFASLSIEQVEQLKVLLDDLARSPALQGDSS